MLAIVLGKWTCWPSVLNAPSQPHPVSTPYSSFKVKVSFHFWAASPRLCEIQWISLPGHHLVLDLVQGMLPPKMAPWHVEYFKLKEFEKMTKIGRSFWTAFHCPSSLKLVIKPAYKKYPPYTQRKGASLPLKTKEVQEESPQISLTKFPPVYY